MKGYRSTPSLNILPNPYHQIISYKPLLRLLIHVQVSFLTPIPRPATFTGHFLSQI